MRYQISPSRPDSCSDNGFLVPLGAWLTPKVTPYRRTAVATDPQTDRVAGDHSPVLIALGGPTEDFEAYGDSVQPIVESIQVDL